jgi:hypothetical protein
MREDGDNLRHVLNRGVYIEVLRYPESSVRLTLP